MGWLTSHDRRADLERLLELIDAQPGPLPVQGGRLAHPWADEPGLPPTLVEV
jgi:hypothetical protein